MSIAEWEALTPIQKRDVVKRHADGHKSAGQIAEILGITRNRVIGVVHRHKGAIRLTGAATGAARAKKRKRATMTPDRKVKFPRTPKAIADALVNGEAWRPLPGSAPATLEHRSGCVWPVTVGGRTLFCNCSVPDDRKLKYCDVHMGKYRLGGA